MDVESFLNYTPEKARVLPAEEALELIGARLFRRVTSYEAHFKLYELDNGFILIDEAEERSHVWLPDWAYLQKYLQQDYIPRTVSYYYMGLYKLQQPRITVVQGIGNIKKIVKRGVDKIISKSISSRSAPYKEVVYQLKDGSIFKIFLSEGEQTADLFEVAEDYFRLQTVSHISSDDKFEEDFLAHIQTYKDKLIEMLALDETQSELQRLEELSYKCFKYNQTKDLLELWIPVTAYMIDILRQRNPGRKFEMIRLQGKRRPYLTHADGEKYDFAAKVLRVFQYIEKYEYFPYGVAYFTCPYRFE